MKWHEIGYNMYMVYHDGDLYIAEKYDWPDCRGDVDQVDIFVTRFSLTTALGKMSFVDDHVFVEKVHVRHGKDYDPEWETRANNVWNNLIENDSDLFFAMLEQKYAVENFTITDKTRTANGALYGKELST